MLDVGAYMKALEVPGLNLSEPLSDLGAVWDASGLSGERGELHV